ncbi:MAG: GlsB/YeaQ/YmgE family stress response membrane protein [Gaiellaceae bacterium]
MGIIGWIILGLLAGFIAKAVLPGEDPGGIIATTLLGVAGALVGGFIAQALGFGDPIDEFFDLSTWLGAIIGAILLLLIYRVLFGGRRTARTL